MNRIVDHLEKYCGEIVEGWNQTPNGTAEPFQVIRMEGGEVPDCVVFSTLGLSNFQLISPTSSRLLRHELLMLAKISQVPENIGPVLQQIADEAILNNCAYIRGQTIGPRNTIFQNSNFTTLYITVPVYFSEKFFSIETEMLGGVAFAWLMPITDRECEFIRSYGWKKFEDRLGELNPDMIDLDRASVI